MDFRTWVSDRVLSLLGLSEETLVDYFIATAKSASSPNALFATLQSVADLPSTPAIKGFVKDLHDRVPRPARSSAGSLQAKERKARDKDSVSLLRKNQSYGLLMDDEDIEQQDDSADTASKKKKKKKDKSSSKKLRKKEEDVGEWDPEEEDKGSASRADLDKDNNGSKETLEQEEEDEFTRQEREREADLLERDEFATRLKERDKEKTKKVTLLLNKSASSTWTHRKGQLVEDKSSKAEQETTMRRAIGSDREQRSAALPDLRERSRQEYLKKREEQRLELLAKRIEDEELLFRGEELSAKERKELELNKQVLKLTRERLQLSEKVDGYVMPEDYITEKGKIDKKKQDSLLYGRYQEEEADKFVSEQDQWEQHQIGKSLAKAGPQDRKPADDSDEYGFVFDEDQQVNFILESAAVKEEIEKLEQGPQLSFAEKKALSMKQVRESLPMFAYREQLLEAITQFQTLIIVGETGSGKTTQIPQYLHEAGYTKNGKKVGCTQPRRVAAMSVASRVADEVGTKVGYEVGYAIRFEDCTSDKTVIKYMTDGMLLREFLTEPDLGGYSCLIIDEAHERTLHTDILFGLVKDIARFRPDLKLLISSATMDAQKFSEYFDDAPIFNIPGRRYPVEVYHTQAPEANYLAAAVTSIMTIHVSQGPGDVLLFLTGQEEIEAAQESLTQICRSLGSKIAELIICPIYANLPSDLQAKIFEPTPPGARKVVLATNIAETSITIDGIVFVIDPGFIKQKTYNPRTGMESLVVVPASRASANQRKGRAGRVGPGKCFRLYTQWAYQNELEENTVPEIQRSNMCNTVLLLKVRFHLSHLSNVYLIFLRYSHLGSMTWWTLISWMRPLQRHSFAPLRHYTH